MDKKVFFVNPTEDDNKTPSMKEFAKKILDLPDYLDKYWDIADTWPKQEEDSIPDLILAHYNELFDPNNRMHDPLRCVRGIIIDTHTGSIVANSYGYTEDLNSTGPLVEDSESISIETTMPQYKKTMEEAPQETPTFVDGVLTIPKSDIRVFVGYEGAMVRIFKWNGHVFFSPHRKIDGRTSFWGTNETFYDMYQRYGGPPVESFFDDEETSPFCYIFLVVDDVMQVSGTIATRGLVFIGVKQMWDQEKMASAGEPYEHTGDFVIRPPHVGGADSKIIMQSDISVNLANKILYPQRFASQAPYPTLENEILISYDDSFNHVDNVFYEPYTSLTIGGDFVLVYHLQQDGSTIVYRLKSSAFIYRSQVMGEDPNPYRRFVVDMQTFNRESAEKIKQTYPEYAVNGHVIPLNNTADRQMYWWNIFMDAVPPAKRKDAKTFLTRYHDDMKKVSHYIYHDYPKLVSKAESCQEQEDDFSKFLLNMIPKRVRKRFDVLRGIAEMNRRRNRPPVKIISSMLLNESGVGLYQMIRSVTKIRRAEAKN